MRNYQLEREVRKAELKPINPITKAISELYPAIPVTGPISAEEVSQRMVQKKAERSRDRVESPYFPGVLFKKTPLHIWIEQEKSEKWETAFDYLHRKYRIEQLTSKQLQQDLMIGKYLVDKILREVGVPPLRSSEYHDPHRAATAKRWEDPSKRELAEKELKQAWRRNKSERVSKTHGTTAKTKRTQALKNLRDRGRVTLESGKSGKQREEQAAKVEKKQIEVLGENPKAKLHQLLVRQGLSYRVACETLDHQVSPYTLFRWAHEFKIKQPKKVKKPTPGTVYRSYQTYKSILEHRDLWPKLSSVQRQVIEFIIEPSSGKMRSQREIAQLLGKTRSAVGFNINNAKAQLDLLALMNKKKNKAS